MMFYGDGWWGGGWMIVVWVILAVVIVWGVVMLIRHNNNSGISSGPHRTPLDIAKERYARGEITREEFERIKRDLD